MSYLVLARKWRPQKFGDIVGQETTARTLKNAVGSGRIAHAYLFSGIRGVGKTSTARILAKALNCVEGPTPVPCGECDPCREIVEDSSMDVMEIDAASNTGVDNVRELRENAKYPPSRDRYKIYIIDEVHMLSRAAFNALLKILEEPPDHVIFIFATTELHKIPITIISRCQQFKFKRIPGEKIFGRLREVVEDEDIDVSEESLRLISRAAGGSLRDAISTLDQLISFTGGDIQAEDVEELLGLIDRDILDDITEALVEGDFPTGLELIDRLINYGYDVENFCHTFLEHIRDIIVLKSGGSGDEFGIPPGNADKLLKLTEDLTTDDLLRFFDVISETIDDLRGTKTPRFVLEMAFLRMIRIKTLTPIEDIIDQLGGGDLEISQGDEVSREKPETIFEADESPEPSTEGDDRIEKIIKRIKDEGKVLSKVINRAGSLNLNDKTFTLVFEEELNGFFKNTLKNNDNLIEEILKEVTGKRMELEIIEETAEETPEDEIDESEKLKERIKDNGLVSEIIDKFQGKIVDFEEPNLKGEKQ